MRITLATPLKIFINFLYFCFGVLNSPYQTIRKVVLKKALSPLVFFAILSWFYLAMAVSLRFGLHTGPLFLTFNLGRLYYAVLTTFLVISLSMYIVGRLLGGKGEILGILSAWSFSYLPTLIWFILTTVLYILVPPPRTQSFLGQIFSIFFLFVSLGLFLWKLILYFLTLRFGLKLNLWQIARATMILWPFYFMYFLLLNRMEIFKIPFA